MGLGSKLNTSEIIDRFIKIEKRRLQPVEQRKEEKLQQVDAWAALQTEINKLKDTVDSLDRKDIWEAKKITSSKPDIVTVTEELLQILARQQLLLTRLPLHTN